MPKTASSLLLAALLVLTSCSWWPRPPLAAPWVPVQSEMSAAWWRGGIRQLVVMPFDVQDALPISADTIREALLLSLRDRNWFQVRSLQRAELGRSAVDEIAWTGALPISTLIRLHRDFAADAVLFGSVTYSRSTGLPAVGLKLTLVDARSGQLLWVADDVVDAHQPHVRAALSTFLLENGDGGHTQEPDPEQVPLAVYARFVGRSFVAALEPPLVIAGVPEQIPEKDL